MKQGFAYSLAVVGVVATIAVIALNDNMSSTSLHQMEITQDNVDFANYIAKHGKRYGTTAEYQFRLKQYKETVTKINIEN